MDNPRKDLTRLLVDKGLITSEQLDNVYKLHSEKGGSFSDLLIQLEYVDEKDLMMFFSTYLSIPPIKILNLKLSPEVLTLIPKEMVRKYLAIPVGRIGNTITVALADPLDFVVIEDLETITKCNISTVIASRSEIQQAIDTYYKESLTSAIEDIIGGSEQIDSLELVEERRDEVRDEDILRSIDEAPVIKLTNYILKRAVEEKASDILIEPTGTNSRIRFRLDGILHEAETFPKKMHNFVISRVKVVANLNITEHRIPQDGRFRMNILGNDVDFRVSILPSTLGEKIALRILDKSVGLLDLISLGFEEDTTEIIQKDALSSYGMIIVCGPTGSGKTTTMYSLLRHIYSPEKNIITVEDPIEYQLKGINQVNVNYEVDLTFASTLRSMLRQDPDVIMVGEIRDFDTVDIAIKAALTGHLVLSTLHTTTAAGSVTRLANMGVEPFLLSSTLIGVLAQRLIRKLCPKCKVANPLDKEARERLRIKKDVRIYDAKGCSNCFQRGYKGRIALCEYLHLDANLRRLVNEASNQHAIKKEARKRKMRTLREDGIVKVEKGLTSIAEVLKVTASDEG